MKIKMANLLIISAMFSAGAASQTDEARPAELLRAAIQTEKAISHGEIVFRFEMKPGADINASLSHVEEHIPPRATIIFTFRDSKQFRIVVQNDAGTSRTIVSDGEFIDMGDGDIWEYRFLDERSGVVSDNDLFESRMWPYYAVVQPHLFPQSKGPFAWPPGTRRNGLVFERGDDDLSGSVAIRTSVTNSYTRFVLQPEFGHRLSAREFFFKGKLLSQSTWAEERKLEDSRFVYGRYQITMFGKSEDCTYSSEIDFSASNFLHLPIISEFTIDHDAANDIVQWWPRNELAERVEDAVQNWAGISVDVEPVLVFGIAIIVGFVGAIGMLIAFRFMRRS